MISISEADKAIMTLINHYPDEIYRELRKATDIAVEVLEMFKKNKLKKERRRESYRVEWIMDGMRGYKKSNYHPDFSTAMLEYKLLKRNPNCIARRIVKRTEVFEIIQENEGSLA